MKTLCTGAFVALMFSVSAAFAGWGAIAYNSETGVAGESHEYPSAGAAQAAALDFCGGGCQIIAFEQNSCIALATNSSGNWGWSLRTFQDEAIREAIERCGGDCDLNQWACD